MSQQSCSFHACDCAGFAPNHFKRSKCVNCYHDVLHHHSQVQAKPQPDAFLAAAEKEDLVGLANQIKAGVDSNVTNPGGNTALHLACENGHHSVVTFLCTHVEALALQTTNANGDTPLFVAAGLGHLTIVRQLVEAKADLNFAKGNGWTALIAAAENGHIEVVKYLVSAGAHISTDSEQGEAISVFDINSRGATKAQIREAVGLVRRSSLGTDWDNIKPVRKESRSRSLPPADIPSDFLEKFQKFEGNESDRKDPRSPITSPTNVKVNSRKLNFAAAPQSTSPSTPVTQPIKSPPSLQPQQAPLLPPSPKHLREEKTTKEKDMKLRAAKRPSVDTTSIQSVKSLRDAFLKKYDDKRPPRRSRSLIMTGAVQELKRDPLSDEHGASGVLFGSSPPLSRSSSSTGSIILGGNFSPEAGNDILSDTGGRDSLDEDSIEHNVDADDDGTEDVSRQPSFQKRGSLIVAEGDPDAAGESNGLDIDLNDLEGAEDYDEEEDEKWVMSLETIEEETAEDLYESESSESEEEIIDESILSRSVTRTNSQVLAEAQILDDHTWGDEDHPEESATRQVSLSVGGDLAGFLMKRGGVVKNWKRRWFQVMDMDSRGNPWRLCYFRHQEEVSRGKHPLGSIDLKAADVDDVPADEFPAHEHCFSLAMAKAKGGTSRTYYMDAPSEHLKKQWMTYLRGCIRKALEAAEQRKKEESLFFLPANRAAPVRTPNARPLPTNAQIPTIDQQSVTEDAKGSLHTIRKERLESQRSETEESTPETDKGALLKSQLAALQQNSAARRFGYRGKMRAMRQKASTEESDDNEATSPSEQSPQSGLRPRRKVLSWKQIKEQGAGGSEVSVGTSPSEANQAKGNDLKAKLAMLDRSRASRKFSRRRPAASTDTNSDSSGAPTGADDSANTDSADKPQEEASAPAPVSSLRMQRRNRIVSWKNRGTAEESQAKGNALKAQLSALQGAKQANLVRQRSAENLTAAEDNTELAEDAAKPDEPAPAPTSSLRQRRQRKVLSWKNVKANAGQVLPTEPTPSAVSTPDTTNQDEQEPAAAAPDGSASEEKAEENDTENDAEDTNPEQDARQRRAQLRAERKAKLFMRSAKRETES